MDFTQGLSGGGLHGGVKYHRRKVEGETEASVDVRRDRTRTQSAHDAERRTPHTHTARPELVDVIISEQGAAVEDSLPVTATTE